MNVQWQTQLRGRQVVDEDGRRLGRLATAYGNCTPDLYNVVWLVVRLPGIRPRWRAMPAEQTCGTPASQVCACRFGASRYGPAQPSTRTPSTSPPAAATSNSSTRRRTGASTTNDGSTLA
jgi:hypothetical protein